MTQHTEFAELDTVNWPNFLPRPIFFKCFPCAWVVIIFAFQTLWEIKDFYYRLVSWWTKENWPLATSANDTDLEVLRNNFLVGVTWWTKFLRFVMFSFSATLSPRVFFQMPRAHFVRDFFSLKRIKLTKVHIWFPVFTLNNLWIYLDFRFSSKTHLKINLFRGLQFFLTFLYDWT